MTSPHPLPENPEQLLPPEAYTSQDWYDLEQKYLFSNTWTYAGIASEMPNTGDYVSLVAGNYRLIVLRGDDGELRAFHNICRHRGTELLEEGSGCAGKAVMCPYHRWVFDLDGQLRGLPNQTECFPDMKKEDYSLFPASIGVFKDLVFVHPSAEPQDSFDSWLSTLSDIPWPHDLASGDLVPTDEVVYEMKCNWKVFYENAIDGYHLAYLHENTLGGVTPSANVWVDHGRHVVWYSTERDGVKNSTPQLIEDFMKKMRSPKITGTEDGNYPGVYMLFPTTIITPSPYGISVSQLVPVSPEVTLLKARAWRPKKSSYRQSIKDLPGYDADSGLVKSENWKQHPLETLDFQTEDVWVCEKMQRALHSPQYAVGALARGAGGEAPLAHFQKSILDFVPLSHQAQAAE